MNKNKIFIAEKTLKLLETEPWNKINLNKVLGKNNKDIFSSKKDLLKNINAYFDYLLKKNTNNMEPSSPKDMLFEVMMAKFDVLNLYRKSVKNLLKYIRKNPQEFITSAPLLIESMILISTLAGINVNGVKGLAKVKVILVTYVILISTWSNDETEGLESTMNTLDKYLNQIDKFAKYIR